MKVNLELDLTTSDGRKILKAISDVLMPSTVTHGGPDSLAANAPITKPVAIPAAKPAVVPVAKPAAAPVAKPAEPIVKEVKTAEEAQEEVELTVDTLRMKVSNLVTKGHRDVIKEELTKLGAKNVSTLSEDQYETFNNFLETIK